MSLFTEACSPGKIVQLGAFQGVFRLNLNLKISWKYQFSQQTTTAKAATVNSYIINTIVFIQVLYIVLVFS